jgi:hypothetical protein
MLSPSSGLKWRDAGKWRDLYRVRKREGPISQPAIGTFRIHKKNKKSLLIFEEFL